MRKPNGIARLKFLLGLALGKVAGATPASGTWSYYNTDHLGSPRRIRNASKALTGAVDFSPYGKIEARTANAPMQQFTGHLGFGSTSSILSPFRTYDPTQQRWGMRDPEGRVDGFNLYGYVRGNPVRFTDALGLAIDQGLGEYKSLMERIASIQRNAAQASLAIFKKLGPKIAALKAKIIAAIRRGISPSVDNFVYNDCVRTARLEYTARMAQIAVEETAIGDILELVGSSLAGLVATHFAVVVFGVAITWQIEFVLGIAIGFVIMVGRRTFNSDVVSAIGAVVNLSFQRFGAEYSFRLAKKECEKTWLRK